MMEWLLSLEAQALSFDAAALTALFSVVMIDLALAGDNAIVVGMAAAGLPARLRRRAIVVGIVAAAVLRIIFASFTVQLLEIVGLLLAGGILLLWVAWKLWRELRSGNDDVDSQGNLTSDSDTVSSSTGSEKTFGQALTQIVIADVSMSLDNVLAVAGAAREHELVLIIGLTLSVALMGVAASWIAHLLHRYRWIGYVGLAIIVVVACRMIYDGFIEVSAAV